MIPMLAVTGKVGYVGSTELVVMRDAMDSTNSIERGERRRGGYIDIS